MHDFFRRSNLNYYETGMTLLAFERGYAKLKMPFDINKNHLGTMYAGSLFSVAQFAFEAVVTSAFHVSKFKPKI